MKATKATKKKEYSKRIGIALKPTQRRLIEQAAKRRGETISEFTRNAIQDRMQA